MIDVLVVDDHPLTRAGWRLVLEREEDIRVRAEAASAASALQMLAETRIDVVILDLVLKQPDGGEEFGLDILARLRAEGHRHPVLVVTMLEERMFLLQALKSGASGYLQKDAPCEILVRGVREVAAGRRFLHDRQQDLVAAIIVGEALPLPHERLTPAELPVFLALGRGRTVAEISSQTGKSTSTIHNQRQSCLEKTLLHNNAEIMLYCCHHGLV